MSDTVTAEPTFIEHVHELRKRLLISVICMGVGAGIGWALFDHIILLLSQPFQQTLYYSAPTGELSFTIKVCIIFGIVFAAPVVFYQVLKFIQPVLSKTLRKGIPLFCLLSVLLAVGGVAFAYFVSLPLTLQFLLNMQTGHGIIEPLISVDEYFNFVLAYIAGFAVLFQIPLFVLIINKITPLTPSSLFKSFRFVVIFSFIAAAIITPTPDPINQTIMAVPVITLYFISAMLLVITQLLRRKPRGQRTPLSGAEEVPVLKAKIPENLLPSAPAPVLTSMPLAKQFSTSPAHEEKAPVTKPLPEPVMKDSPLTQQLFSSPAKEKAVTPVPVKTRPAPRILQDIKRVERMPERPQLPSRPIQKRPVVSEFLKPVAVPNVRILVK